jgi:hypothetical protein
VAGAYSSAVHCACLLDQLTLRSPLDSALCGSPASRCEPPGPLPSPHEKTSAKERANPIRPKRTRQALAEAKNVGTREKKGWETFSAKRAARGSAPCDSTRRQSSARPSAKTRDKVHTLPPLRWERRLPTMKISYKQVFVNKRCAVCAWQRAGDSGVFRERSA